MALTCTIEGCNEPTGYPGARNGFCASHYYRLKKYGDPRAPLVKGRTLEERFWQRVDKSGECWTWTGGMNPKGYGSFCIGPGRYALAHRWGYELLVGPIPEGLQLDHLCRTRSCVRPDHLEPVTHTENQRRGYAFSGLNARKKRCIRGHDLTDPENSYGYSGRRQCKLCAQERARAAFLDPPTREEALERKRAAHRARREAQGLPVRKRPQVG